MIRIVIFALLVLALGFGFSWLADRPGELSIVWEGQLIEMSLMVAASLVTGLVAAIMISWWLVRSIWTSPYAINRYFRARKRDRGYQALSTGLLAAGAGNAALAHKMNSRARSLLRADQEPLIHLLEAQTALIEGKYDAARQKFEAMANDPETRELGLRGLYSEARRLGAHEAAMQYAEDAAESAPWLPWAAQAALEFRSRSGKWDEAIRLLDQQKAAGVLDRGEAERLKAVLLTARAGEKLESDPKAARDDATQALKYAKSLVPAAIIAAKAWIREDNLRKAASVLEQVWKITPHPQIAATYLRARSGDSAVDRLKRADKLEALKPNNVESLLIVARAALDAREFEKARRKAEAAARIAPREEIYLLLADIEEADTGDQGRVRFWMAQALRAPRDPAWVADGVVSDTWLPVSPETGRLDAFEWKIPFGQIGNTPEATRAGVETVLASLPAVSHAPPEHAPAHHTPAQNATPHHAPKEDVAEHHAAAPVVHEKAGKSDEAKEIIAPPPSRQDSVEKEPVPFFGGLPDDPGVKDPSSQTDSKTRLKLF